MAADKARKTIGAGGQALGNKGQDTRRLLIAAARRLIERLSPMQITATAISREANTAPPTFYVYFKDVEDILWALCDSVTEDMTHLFTGPDFLRTPGRLEEDALALVKGYSEIWSRNAAILSYRNLEADRGNARFNLLLTRTGLPILQGLTDRISEAATQSPVRRKEANAEAVVIISAMDRLSAAVLLYPDQSVVPELLHDALARIIVRSLRRD